MSAEPELTAWWRCEQCEMWNW